MSSRPARLRPVFLCLSLVAACADARPVDTPKIGLTTQALCNCDQNPNPCCCESPIILDIAGNGFRLTSFEDGVEVATRPGYERTERAWTEPGSDDAWLVLDRNGDGIINDFSEMFGSATPQPKPAEGQPRNGFLALAVFDDNGDGKIDGADETFNNLRLWQDKSHNGESEPEELHALTELGVAGLSVAYSEDRHADDYGNLYRYKASVYGIPGSTVGSEAWDVWLAGARPVVAKTSPRVGFQSMPLVIADSGAESTANPDAIGSEERVEGAASGGGYYYVYRCDASCTQKSLPPWDASVCTPVRLEHALGLDGSTRQDGCTLAKLICASTLVTDTHRCTIDTNTCNPNNCTKILRSDPNPGCN